MNDIRMVDLHGQYLRYQDEIDAAIKEVLTSTAFIKGPAVSEFQDKLADYLGIDHSIACGNGTDALQVALMALDLNPGDEVITTPFTFIATIEVISLLGLQPVLVDVEPDSFNIDPSKIESILSDRSRAIIPVHLFGQAANMEKIIEIAEKNNLYVIEDNAQAIGADYRFTDGRTKKTGTIGNIGCTSFFPSKNLGAYGDGGAIFTNDKDLGTRIASMVNHGMTQRYHYEHIGVNSRLDTMQAAILNVKLKYLDEFNKSRQKVANAYDQAFKEIPGIDIPFRAGHSNHVFHQYTIKVRDGLRDDLKTHLSENNIPAMIYYPYPLHIQNAYKNLNYKAGDFPVAEFLCQEVLSLPIHTEMEQDQLNHIIKTVLEFFEQ